MSKIIIAIDGHSSCGKSSTAKKAAANMAYSYIDTGAMYRAVTLYFLQNHVSVSNQKEVENFNYEVIVNGEYWSIKKHLYDLLPDEFTSKQAKEICKINNLPERKFEITMKKKDFASMFKQEGRGKFSKIVP
jgi:cytidylate kinase